MFSVSDISCAAKNDEEDPTKLLIHDYPSIISGVVWVISILTIIFAHEELEHVYLKFF